MTKALETFDRELSGAHLRGQWVSEPLLDGLVDGPKPVGVPYLWQWAEINEKLVEACDILPESFTARRAVICMNPSIPAGSTHTIAMGVQMVKPREIAWAHRHTLTAVRFTIAGNTMLRTVVNGEPFQMEQNDLILTPNWTWHDHRNESDQSGIWLDVLDAGIAFGLSQVFYAPYGQSTQPLLTPTTPAPMRYAWRDVRPAIDALAALPENAHDGYVFDYLDPHSGRSPLATLACSAQRLPPGFSGREHRHTSSTVYHVVEGHGTTVAGDTELQWEPRDCFVLPNWVRHRHLNRSEQDDAILFSVSDRPALEALGFYREER